MSTSQKVIHLGDFRVKAAHRRTHNGDAGALTPGFNPARDLHPSLFAYLANTAAETEEWRLDGAVVLKKKPGCGAQATCHLKVRRLFQGCDITFLWYDPIFQANLALTVGKRLEILAPDRFAASGKPPTTRIFSGSSGYSQVRGKSPTMNFGMDDNIAAGLDTLSSHVLLSFMARIAGSGGDPREDRGGKRAWCSGKEEKMDF